MTTVYNTNQATAFSRFFVNAQIQSNNLVAGGTPPPTPVPPTPPEANIIFLSNFVDGEIKAKANMVDGWAIQPAPSAYPNENIGDDVSMTASPSRNGNYSVDFTLTRADWPIDNGTTKGLSPRCQLMKPKDYLNFSYDTEYYAGFALYIPAGGWDTADVPSNAEVLMWQVHGTGASGGSPPIWMSLDPDGFAIKCRSGNTLSGGLTQHRVYEAADLPRDQWIDIVVRFKMHITDGYMDVWINSDVQNTPTDTYVGPTTYGGQDGNPVTQPSDGYISHMIYFPKYDDYPAYQLAPEYQMYQAEIRYAQGENQLAAVYPGTYA